MTQRYASEHDLQVQCIRWFDLTHRPIQNVLFAIPNGGQRNAATGAKLKAEGVRAGVWDLFYAQFADVKGHIYGGLFIEMKNGKNRLTESQRLFMECLEPAYAFAVVRTLDEFIEVITSYDERRFTPERWVK